MTLLRDLLSPSVPDAKLLYHYTGQEGLLGMVGEKRLRVSSILHLNDAAEFNYTIGLAQEYLNIRLRHERGPWNTFYGTVLEALGHLKTMTLFVGSFSENGDSLSQWRAYAHNGIGFSLGFEYDYLRRLAAAQDFRLLRCNYSQKDHTQVINEIVARAGGQINIHEADNVEPAVEQFNDSLVKIAAVLKHPSFAEEREWRLISSPVFLDQRPPASFRPGKSMVIPYREFSLMSEGVPMRIADLCVGPTPHMELSRLSVEYLLGASNVEHGVVRGSDVPYRGW